MTSIKFIEPNELKNIIKDKTKIPGKDYLIVDVRDEDYSVTAIYNFILKKSDFGNIPNSVNKPSSEINDSLESLISDYIPQLIFTCALSQVRGPKCARIYSERIALKNVKTDQKVLVLRGGVAGWQKENGQDIELMENYDREHWVLEIYSERIALKNVKTDQKVLVLRGGVAGWQKENGQDIELMENYDREHWVLEYGDY
ncbi:13174_t:CDS:2 [Entrophospora sp. SA101]|nr:13174_t:CDS:2 [Entrophospora sp. SA101]CAJ0895496.1 1506_t:CDS:2 [Entrophospora sp. SA101]